MFSSQQCKGPGGTILCTAFSDLLGINRGLCVCVFISMYIGTQASSVCPGVTSHLHRLPEGTAVRQAIDAEGTQVTATPVINDIAPSSTPVWAHRGALEGLQRITGERNAIIFWKCPYVLTPSSLSQTQPFFFWMMTFNWHIHYLLIVP